MENTQDNSTKIKKQLIFGIAVSHKNQGEGNGRMYIINPIKDAVMNSTEGFLILDTKGDDGDSIEAYCCEFSINHGSFSFMAYPSKKKWLELLESDLSDSNEITEVKKIIKRMENEHSG